MSFRSELLIEIAYADVAVEQAEYQYGVSGGIEPHRRLAELRGRRAGLRKAFELYEKAQENHAKSLR